MKYLGAFICWFLCYVSSAQKSFLYRNTSELVSIDSSVYYFIDSSKNLNFAQIKHLPENVFKLNEKKYVNFGNTESTIWLRIDLVNQLNEELYLLQQLHDVRLLDVHLINKNDSTRSWFTGAMRPFGTHFLKRNSMIFDLGKYPKRIYLRIQNPNIYMPLKLGNIETVTSHFHNYDLIYGGIYGILFALIIYNLFVFWVVRDRVFLYYLFCIVCSGYVFFRVDNHLQEFIFKQIPNFSFDINFSSTIAIFSVFLFSNSYLKIKEIAPKFYWTLASLCTIGFVLLPSEWLPYKAWVNDVYQLLVISFMAVLFVASIYINFLGFKPARYFILAFGFYIVVMISILLSFMGIMSIEIIRSAYIYQICFGLEALFFSFVVAYRLNTFRKETIDAQEIALKRSQEHEELLIKNNQLLAEKLQIEQSIKTYHGDKSITQLLQEVQSGNQLIKKISVPTIEGVIMFPVQDINRLEAMGSYCIIHFSKNKKLTTSKPMSHFEQMIDSDQFMRIHKSHIINLNNVVRYIRGEGGSVEMHDKSEVPVSRRLKTELLQRLSIEQPAV
jgi:two-component system, sensor histidine kinase LadS